MSLKIRKEVTALKRMTVRQLQDKYFDVFGETTNGRHKQWLIKRIAWRVQVNEYGGLSDRAFARARGIANTSDLRVIPPCDPTEVPERIPDRTKLHLKNQDDGLPASGLTIRRVYKGIEYIVTVMEDGFELEGECYKSLTAIAKKITGQHRNGDRFFKLQKTETRP